MRILTILLLDRGYEPQLIAKLTGEKIANIYYANKRYKLEAPKLKEILNAHKVGAVISTQSQ